jgi:hypothetical protein
MKKVKEVAPDWAGIAAAREREIKELRQKVDIAESEAAFFKRKLMFHAESLDRVVGALDEIEPQCHRRDLKGAEVVALVRRALEGGSDE